MNHSGGNFADETSEMVSENVANAGPELRKRRSTRIVQAVPLVVTGVDALGRPFVERTSSLIINCHGCRYQSKHYVLKNMWVTLEVPHPESGQPPRNVRGRVAWIQRPRTVRQLFQVALELEVAGNAWGIAFPPEDWFPFPDQPQTTAKPELPVESVPALSAPDDTVVEPPAPEAELQPAAAADAKQQILTAAREAASQAVSAEQRLSFEQWEQKFAAGRAEIVHEAERAIERFQQQSDAHSRTIHAAAAEALHNELPRWLAPQLEQLTRDLTTRLSQEATAQHHEQAQQLESRATALRDACQQAEEAAARLKTEEEQTETLIAARTEAASRALDEAAKRSEEAAKAQSEALGTSAREIQDRLTAALANAQASWQGQLTEELGAAQKRWRESLETTLAEAQDRASGGLNEHVRVLMSQFQEELTRHAAAVKDSTTGLIAESEQRIHALRDMAQEQAQRLESALGRATEISERIEHHSEQLEGAQRQALESFQSQLDDVLTLHRNELHRRSESLFEEINQTIRSAFEECSRQTLEQFQRQVGEMVQPHISRTEEAINKLAGGQSLLDAALTMQRDRIRSCADEAFAESLGHFRENLGGVEQILQEASQTVIGRNLSELEEKASDLKHHLVEEFLKSAEWYEKKAQTQIQNQAERAVEQAANQMREKAGEISGVFASELDHSSRSFVGHTQTQMEEILRDGFDRARVLFAEAADTTVAAFTDEIQRTGRRELDGYGEELQRSTAEARAQMQEAHDELNHRVTTDQEEFLRRFHATMGGAIEAGVTDAQKKVQEGFGPLLESWKSITLAHQQEMERIYSQMGEQATEQYKNRLENVSNQWMLATVAALDHQSRDIVSGIAATAEEKLREACTQVLAGVGESLRERLREIALSFTAQTGQAARAKSANTGN
jgi:vacuolar-type H+-ATPase subunit E/Vma4